MIPIFKEDVYMSESDSHYQSILKEYLKEKMIAKGEKIDMTNNSNVIYIAIKDFRNDIAEYLINKIENVNEETRRGLTLLYSSLEHKNYEIAKFLIKVKKVDINYINRKGENILIYLIRRKALTSKSLTLLLHHGINLNYQDNDGKTCFIYLVDYKQSQFFKQIIEKYLYDNFFVLDCLLSWKNKYQHISDTLTRELSKINFNLKDKFGDSVLFYAIRRGDYSTFKLIMDYNDAFNPNEHNNSNYSLLHEAIRYSQTDIVKLLIERNVQVDVIDKFGKTPFIYACQCRQEVIVKLLVSTNQIHFTQYHQNREIYSFLCYLCRCGDTNLLNYFIQNGFSLDSKNYNGNIPLLIAVEYQQLDVIQYLLNHHVDIHDKDSRGKSAIILAMSDKRLKSKIVDFELLKKIKQILEILLNHGADVNDKDKNGYSLLMIACQTGHKEIVELLIRHGANIHETTSSGYTPIILACQNGYVDVVDVLVQQGANLHQPDERQLTPLIHAIQGRHMKVIEYLVQHDADVNVRDQQGHTPLIYASYTRNVEIMKYLLDNGAEINIQDHRGESCLIQSIGYNYESVVRLLLQYHANILLLDHNRKSALDYAKERNLGIIEKLLIENGAY